MTNVSITKDEYQVTVTEGVTQTVTVKAPGPQGPAIPDGNKGDITVSNNGDNIVINSDVVTYDKIQDLTTANRVLGGSAAGTLGEVQITDAMVASAADISGSKLLDDSVPLTKLGSGALPSDITIATENIPDFTIVNADVSASAAIAGSKITPDFGSQSIISTGNISGAVVTGTSFSGDGASITNINAANISTGQINSARVPTLNQNTTGSAAKLTTARTIAGVSFDGSANIDISYANLTNKLTVGDGGLTQNNFTNTLKTKLDGIESGATADQTASEIKTLLQSDKLTVDEIADGQINSAKIVNGSIVNVDINASAGISISKLGVLSANTLVGRRVSNGTPQELTASQVRTILNVEDGATGDQTASEIVSLIASQTIAPSALSDGVTATTQSAGDNSTKVATTAYTDTAISNLVDSAPSTLNTLKELSDALGSDANFSTTVTNSIATKMPLSGGEFTGNITFSGTQTVDGRDLSVDGTKLDGIESNATADQTASEIVALVADQTIAPSTIDMDDNEKIKLGTGDDLELFHTGSISYIENTAGNLHIRNQASSGQIKLQPKSGEDGINVIQDAAVELYFDNSKKIETTSTGVDVTGTINTDGLAVNKAVNDTDFTNDNLPGSTSGLYVANSQQANGIWSALSAMAFNDITNNQSASFIVKSVDGFTTTPEVYITQRVINTQRTAIKISNDGSVDINFDGSTKLSTNSSGATVTGDLLVGPEDAEVKAGGFYFSNNIGSPMSSDGIRRVTTGTMVFDTGSTERMRLDSNGSLLIGGTSSIGAAYPLQVFDDTDVRMLIANTTAASSQDATLFFAPANTVTGSTITCTSEEDFSTSANRTARLTFSTRKDGTLAERLRITSDGNVQIANDSGKLQLGASQDLQIFHDGSGSSIDNATGQLAIACDDAINLQSKTGAEYYFRGFLNDRSELYYDGSKKFETTSTGAKVTGLLDVINNGNVNTKVECTATGSGANAGLNLKSADGGDYFLQTGNAVSGGLRIFDATASATRMTIDSDGDVLVGLTTALSTQAGSIQAAGPIISKSYINAHTSNAAVLQYISNKAVLRAYGATSGSGILQFNVGGGGDTTDFEAMRIDSSGNVSVGGTSPSTQSAKFQTRGTSQNATRINMHHEGNSSASISANGGLVFASDTSNGTTERMVIDTSGNLNLPSDTGKIRLGVGLDFDIFHDGAENFIQTNNGNLRIRNSAENMARFVPNGEAELYFDNSKKFETTSDGSSVFGKLSFGGSGTAIKANDDRTIELGNSSDLKIYHNGSNSVIEDSGTGNLNILTSALAIKNAASNENMIVASQNGNVELYYDNTKKLQTLSTGVHFVAAHTFMDDNYRARFGASDDLQIYHDGANTFLDNNTGDFFIRNNSNAIKIRPKNDEESIVAHENGAVILNFDNSTKLETTSTGINVTNDITNTSGSDLVINSTGRVQLQVANGEKAVYCDNNGAVELYFDNSKKLETKGYGVVVSGHVELDSGSSLFKAPDNAKLNLGNSNDLQIYHDGGNSWLKEQGTGALYIDSNGSVINLTKDNASEAMAKFYTNGAVELYFDNSKKFATTTDGIQLFGNGYIDFPDNGRIRMGAGFDLAISHDGTNNKIEGSAPLFLRTNSLLVQNGAGTEGYMQATENGAVELFFDNSKKLETTSTGVLISGNIDAGTGNFLTDDNGKFFAGTAGDLQIFHDGTNSIIKNTQGQTRLVQDYFAVRNGADNEYMIYGQVDDTVQLYYDGSLKLETTSAGATVTGKLGINVSSPGSTLQLQDTDPAIHIVRNFGSGSSDIGSINFGNNNIDSDLARITAVGDGATDNAALVFKTQATGNVVTERMRIDSSGNVYFGVTSTPDGTNVGGAAFIPESFNRTTLYLATTANTKSLARFHNENGQVGVITVSGSSTAYTTSSDYRLKENITAISDAITRLKTLKPYRFNFKSDASTTVDGFLAHEVTAVPEAITGIKDETQDILYTEEDTIPSGKKVGDVKETVPIYQGIDQSKLVPLLVAAVQELTAKVEALEAA